MTECLLPHWCHPLTLAPPSGRLETLSCVVLIISFVLLFCYFTYYHAMFNYFSLVSSVTWFVSCLCLGIYLVLSSFSSYLRYKLWLPGVVVFFFNLSIPGQGRDISESETSLIYIERLPQIFFWFPILIVTSALFPWDPRFCKLSQSFDFMYLSVSILSF